MISDDVESYLDRHPEQAQVRPRDDDKASALGQADPQSLSLFWKLAPIIGQELDAYGTRHAMGHGSYEANPIMAPFAKNPAALYAIKGAVGLGGGLLADKLAREGHPGWGKVLSGVLGGGGALAGARNLTQ